jgi:putative transposase
MSREVHVRFCEGLGVKLPWSTHPYIKLENGHAYLAAIIDWYTKKILSWKLSNTMDVYLTVKAIINSSGKGHLNSPP